MIRRRFWVLTLVTIFGLTALPVHADSKKSGHAPKKFQSLDRMLAIVNNDTITESELEYQSNLLLLRLKQSETELPPMAEFKKQILERMVMEKVQLQMATDAAIEIDDATLNNTLEEIASRDGMPLKQMREFLEDQGIPFDYFSGTVKKELILSKLQQKEVGQNISVSKSDIEHFLNSPQGQDKTGYEYKLGHILIALPEAPTPAEIEKAKQQAEEVKKQLMTGANFNTLALAKSAGPQALNGGDLGFKKSTELPTLFAKQTLSLSVNEIYGPIRNASGFHIIKLLAKRSENGLHAEKVNTLTHVRHILIQNNQKTSDEDAKALLTKIHKQIKQGTPFEKLAKKYSEEHGSSSKGGDLGWVSQQMVVPLFYKTMATLQVGDLSQPFKTELGWHLIQVVKRKMQQNTTEAMRAKAMDILYQRKFDDHLASWLKRIREDAEVKVYWHAT